MKVKTQFYCTEEKKVYHAGTTYTGKRDDLGAFMTSAEPDEPKTKTSKK